MRSRSDRTPPPAHPRPARRAASVALLAGAIAASLALGATCNGPNANEKVGFQLFASPNSKPIAMLPDGSTVYVVNTTSNTVQAIDTATQSVVATIPVGVEPSGLAVRPDGLELWVSNHVSDTVSVIDTDPASPTHHTVIQTIGDYGYRWVTKFDEPVGVAFASNSKAYVALSSRNQIAVIDATTYQVTGRLPISAQDPRAITVRDGRLYVLAFESGNQSELSACLDVDGSSQCTLTLNDIGSAATSPNLEGFPSNVVLDPDAPDRDLFVFDTSTDTLVAGGPVEHVGTLLYDLVVDGSGKVFITNTDARNHDQDGNGLAAQPPEGAAQGLADLQNRAFRNRVTEVDCGGASCSAAAPSDLEPPPGSPVPVPLATPFGIAISADDSTLLVTAFGSSRLATVDAATKNVLDTFDLPAGAMPRGVVWDSTGSGGTAWVHNTFDNSVSVVDVSAGGAITGVATIAIGNDPTPEAVRLGRIAFNDANASSSGTFSCGSCHPDGHTDQLLWVIGAECTFSNNCDQEEMRSTMPIRGLRRTIPLHWDGTLGDPFGGPNGEVGAGGSAAPNCSVIDGDEQGCFRQLVDAALSGVMCDQSNNCAGGGELGETERDHMATFLQSVPYPPARGRRLNDSVSPPALAGFRDFFMDVGGNGGGGAQTCGDTTGGCHALPWGTSTNSPVVGAFEAPTMRGMTDRFMQFSGGFTSPEEILDLGQFGTAQGIIPWDPVNVGYDELGVFSMGFFAFNPAYNVFPDDMFRMFEEASTGFSGALGRQVQVNQDTVGSIQTQSLLFALELQDEAGYVNLQGHGTWNDEVYTLSWRPATGRFEAGKVGLGHGMVISEATAGKLNMMFTGHLRMNYGAADHPQPGLGAPDTSTGPLGDPNLPIVAASSPVTIQVAGSDVREFSEVIVDGRPVPGSVTCNGGSFSPFCDTGDVDITLDSTPAEAGVHLLQVRTLFGPVSNEYPFCVGSAGACL